MSVLLLAQFSEMTTLRSDDSNNTFCLFQVNNVENKENGVCGLGLPGLATDAANEIYIVHLNMRRDSMWIWMI
ncbi:hypothetical protein INT43_002874 [Umbelopsis isabellina]|uniref:Uncharacterized protein n=1 Tax=Mortierella isabellina TaxID=91625 RepID=A0A8H7Q7Z6_MORIS|nr:hypothetical protein INT43_002874 [Umbelopsis isabellina]